MSIPTDSPDCWHRCSSCKKPINYTAKYWVCNVSTCNRKRTGLVFCNVSCWDAHVPMMNHRESWAEERTAPTREQWARIQEEEKKPKTRKPKESAETQDSKSTVETAPSSASRVILRRPPTETSED